jgi:hypothetical protein
MQKRTHRIPDCILTASGLSEKALLRLGDQITALRESLTGAAAK